MARRFFRYGELPLVLLALVEEQPRSGYELMGELARLFSPAYRPSPGSVYPALRHLTDERLAAASEGARAAVFAPTEAGRRLLDQRGPELAAFEARTGRRVRGHAEVEAALQRFVAEVRELDGQLSAGLLRGHLDDALAKLRRATSGGQDHQQETYHGR
jgi:DNA-binding PadR family transcriptional regulator